MTPKQTKHMGKTTRCPDVKRRNNLDVIDVSEVPKTTISRVVSDNYNWFKGRVKPQSNAEYEFRVRKFFEACVETGEYPTYEKLALALCTTVKEMWELENRRSDLERAEIIKEAKSLIQAIDAELALRGEINNITWIFRAKNYYGMKDQQDLTITANPIGQIESKEKLLEEVEQLPD